MSFESFVIRPDSTPLLIHIGYHKTATTWMQDVLFKPACSFRPLMSHEEVFAHISGPHPLVFDPEPVRALLAARMAATPQGHAPVVSSENLSGNPFRGGQDSPETARRLHEIAPEAHILVTVREQMSMASSMYMQYLSQGGTLRPEQFFAGPLDLGYPLFDPVHLEYHRLIGLYQELFGTERVHVLTYEQFRTEPERFVAAICSIAGVPESSGTATLAAGTGRNVSRPEYAAPLLRRVNHFRSGPVGPGPVFDLGAAQLAYRGIGRAARMGPVRGLIRQRNPIKAFVTRCFAGRFAESNRTLAALYPDLDLRGYEEIVAPAPAASEPEAALRLLHAGH